MSSNSEFDVDVRKDVMWMEPESNGATSRGVKVVIWTGGVVEAGRVKREGPECALRERAEGVRQAASDG
jgi:hypothetical protein